MFVAKLKYEFIVCEIKDNFVELRAYWVAKKLFLAASFKLLFLPNKSSSKTVPTDAL